MRKRMRRKLGKVRLALLGLFIVGFIAFVVFAVGSERRREAAVASIVAPPQVTFHNRVADALDAPDATPPPELQPAMDSIRRWRALFQRKAAEVDGEEWDTVFDLWNEVDGWDDLAPEVKERIAAFLEEHREFFEDLRRVAADGGPMEAVPRIPAQMDMKHLLAARDTSRLLRLGAICHARNSDTEIAISDCIAGLQFARALRAEPELIAQLTRYGCALITLSAIVEAFPPGTLSETEAARLIYQAQQDNGRAGFVAALQHSRASVTAELCGIADKDWPGRYEDMKRGLFIAQSSLVQQAGAIAYSSPLARPWLNRDITRVSEQLDEVIDVSPYPYYEAVKRYQAPVQGFAPFAGMLTSGTFHNLGAPARHEAMLQLLQIGLTLEQYQASHGVLPDSLNALSSELPDAVLVDPFTGERLAYRVEEDGFTLYSVGQDLQDDGGHHDPVSGDIVWRGQ